MRFFGNHGLTAQRDRTMSYGVRNSAAAAFLVLTLLILGNVFVSYHHLRRLYENHAGLERTSEVRLALKETFSLLKDLELGERGYIITGNEDFLDPYRAAATQLDEQVDRLAELYAGVSRDDD